MRLTGLAPTQRTPTTTRWNSGALGRSARRASSITSWITPTPLVCRRCNSMMDLGFLDEVRSLAALPGGLSRTARQALGYRELLSHVEDGVPLDDAVAEAVRRTRTFARRQWAWFRRDPRILWLEPGEDGVARIADLFGQTLLRQDPPRRWETDLDAENQNHG